MAETIKGLNIKLGLDTSDLDQKLKNINRELREEQKDLRAINNALKFDSSNLDKWREKQDKLNSILEATRKRLEVQNQRLEEAKKALKVGAISEEQFNQVQRSIKYTETDIIKLNNELQRTGDQIKKLGGINTNNLKKIGSSFSKYVTGPIVAATTALYALTLKSMNTANELADNSAKVGMTVEAYQEWGYVAKSLAVDTESLQKALVRTNTILGEVASGSDKYSAALGQLEITTDDLIGKSTDEAFEMIREALSRVEDQALRTAIANEIFGEKLGSELSLVLAATSEEIEELRNQAHELGVVTSEEAETAMKFNDSLNDLKQSISALSVTIGIQVVPILQKFVNNVQTKVIPAIRAITNRWAELSDKTKDIILVFVGVLAAIGPVIGIVLKLIPIINTLKAAMTGGTILKFFQGFSFGKLAIVGLIAALVAILLQNEKFKESLKQIFDAFSKLAEPIGELISTLITKLQPIIDIIIDIINDVIDIVIDLIESIMPVIMLVIEVLVDILGEVIGVITELIADILPILINLFNEVAKVIDQLKPIIQIVIKLVGTIIEQIMKLVMAVLPPIMKILNVIIQLVGSIIQAVGTLINAILTPLESIINLIASAITVVVAILEVVIELIVTVLEPVLEIVFALLVPIFDILMVFIDIITWLMELLSPLIETLLAPLIEQLDFIAYIFEALAPLITMVGKLLGTVLAPVLSLIFDLLEPILWVLDKIIGAASWIIDNLKGVFDVIGGALGKVGNFFGDLFSGELFKKSSASNTTNNTTNNNVTVNTSSSKFDINSIDKALGGAY